MIENQPLEEGVVPPVCPVGSKWYNYFYAFATDGDRLSVNKGRVEAASARDAARLVVQNLSRKLERTLVGSVEGFYDKADRHGFEWTPPLVRE